MSMSIQDKILLLTEGYTTVCVKFKETDVKTYTYKVMKSDNVVAGDSVVVNSPSQGLVVVTVVEAHVEPRIDINANFKYQWIVQKVDTTNYKKRSDLEERLAQSLLEIERQKQRQQLAMELRAQMPELDNILNWVNGELK